MNTLFIFNSIDLTNLTIGFILTILWAVFIFSLKPKLIIKEPTIERGLIDFLKIPISNISRYCRANNITIEAAVIVNVPQNQVYSYHFEMDFKDSVFIETKDTRSFKAIKPNGLTAELYHVNMASLIEMAQNPANYLRVRIHACHSWTGLGKSQEERFCFRNGKFIKI